MTNGQRDLRDHIRDALYHLNRYESSLEDHRQTSKKMVEVARFAYERAQRLHEPIETVTRQNVQAIALRRKKLEALSNAAEHHDVNDPRVQALLEPLEMRTAQEARDEQARALRISLEKKLMLEDSEESASTGENNLNIKPKEDAVDSKSETVSEHKEHEHHEAQETEAAHFRPIYYLNSPPTSSSDPYSDFYFAEDEEADSADDQSSAESNILVASRPKLLAQADESKMKPQKSKARQTSKLPALADSEDHQLKEQAPKFGSTPKKGTKRQRKD